VLEAVRKHLFTEENLSEVMRYARQGLKARAAQARAKAGRRKTGGRRLKDLEREIGNVLAAVRAGGDNGGATLLRQELDRLTAERERLAAGVGDPGDGRAVEEALERALAQVPQAVEEYFGKQDLAELTDPRYLARAREVLADLLSEIVVVPAQMEEGRPCYAVTLKGDLPAAFRLLGGKRKVVSEHGSGGALRSGKEDKTSPLDARNPLQARS